MKRIGYIFTLCLIWIICGSRSCGDGESLKDQWERKHLTATRDSIKQASEVDSLNDQLKKAYEVKAIQELSDFADYLKIASDSSLNATFRKQAVGMAGKLFISKEINILNWSKVIDRPDLNSLEQLLVEILKQGSSSWIQPDQIKVMKPLTQENDSSFKGRLSFNYKCLPYGKQYSIQDKSGKLEIDFYALRKVKSFGKEQLRVWEVYLGNFN
jgi:hypothetical protein